MTLGAFFNRPPLHLLIQDLSLDPELNDSSYSSWPAYPRDSPATVPCMLELQAACMHAWPLGGLWRSGHSVLTLACPAIYSLRHFPSPRTERSYVGKRAVFSLTPKHVSAYFVNRGVTPRTNWGRGGSPRQCPSSSPNQMGDTETHMVSHD